MMASVAIAVELFLPGPLLLKMGFGLIVSVLTLIANALWLSPWPAGDTPEGRKAAMTLYWVPATMLAVAALIAALK